MKRPRKQVAASAKTGSSPAVTLLRERGVDFRLHEYEHDRHSHDFGDEVVRELCATLTCEPMVIFKTLIWQVDGQNYVAVIPVPCKLAPKRLAAAVGGRRAAIADSKLAERVSGSVVGAISPLGLRTQIPVVLDASALDHPTIFISAGRRGLEIEIAPQALIAETRAQIARLTTDVTAS